MQRTSILLLVILTTLPAFLVASYLGSEDFESVLDEKTASELRYAKNVQILRDGDESFPVRKALIENAREYLLFQTFIFRKNPVSEHFLELTTERAEEGVQVKFIYDLLGIAAFNPFFVCRIKNLLFETRYHLSVLGEDREPNRIWHEKIMIADGESAIVGGMHLDVINVDREFLWFELPAQRDLDILVEGPIVQDIQASFAENWELVGEELDLKAEPVPQYPYEGDILMRFVTQKPMLHEDYRINNLYVEAINAAEHTILIETPYLSPADEIIDALVEAAQRGVDIKILVNSIWTMDHFYLYPFIRAYYPVFLREGIKIYETLERMTHAKLAVFDGVYSIAGSYNLSIRSAYRDTESVLAFFCPELSGKLQEWFEDGLAEARRAFSLFW